MSPLERRRARVHDIRMRVVAVAVSLFIVVFAGITVQLASGHDPALSKPAASTTTNATKTRTSTSSESDDSSQLAPVTTSQS